MNLKGLCGIFVAWMAAAMMAQGQTWTSQDVGIVGVTGSATALSANAFAVTASGVDIWNPPDSFRFVYQTLTGDGEVIARVVSVPTVDGWSKAGLMIRGGLDATATNATLALTRDNGIQFSYRKYTGGSGSGQVTLAGRYAPQWLKLIRTGTNFSAYTSLDNVTWEYIGTDTISMAASVYIGLAVASHNNTVLGTATFDNVSVVPGTIAAGGTPQPPTLVAGPRSDSSVALSWGGATDGLGIASYEVDRNGVAVATVPGTTSSYIDNGLTPSTPYVYTVKASNASGNMSQASNSVSINTDAAGVGAFAASLDIGAVGKTGSTTFVSASSSYTLQGAGADISGTADAFRFGYKPSNGDTQIVVRVASIQNINGWSKAGAMIRESLNANSTEASVLMTYSGGVVFQSRIATGGTTSTTATYAYASISGRRAPQWVKLERHGNSFNGYVSDDGVDWEYVGGDTIAMASSAYAGLAVSSHNTSSLCSAVLTNLEITAPVDAASPSSSYGLNIYSLSDVSLSLSWVPASDDVAVDAYKVFQDGVWIGTTPFARFTDTFQYPGSSHNYSVQAVDSAGNVSAASDVLAVTLKPAALPDPWQHDDIGVVDWAGSASLTSGTFGISGAGLDIGSSQDSFHYIYQPLNGDQTIVARIGSIPNPPNTSVKAGVMIRETLDAGSRNAMFLVLGGSGASLQWRAVTGGTSSGLNGDTKAKAPYWVKLVRGGSSFAGYQSADGVNWTLAGMCSVPMNASAYIGLAFTSHDPRVLASATFDSVQITTDSDNNGLPDAWELAWFNKIGVDPNALASRNDGLTNLQAYQQGLNPLDYYNGVAPTITKVSGDNQNGAVNTLLNLPLTVRVTGGGGVPIVNAPVTVSVPAGGGLVSAAPGSTGTSSAVFHSDANGQFGVYYQEGANWGINSQIKLVAGKTTATFAATASPKVGYWTFNSHTGNTTPDSSSTGNNGAAIGGVTWGTGFDGSGAVALDGSTGYVEAAASPTMALGAGPVSITAWVRFPQNLSLADESSIYPLITLGDGSVDGLSISVRGGGHGIEARLNTAYGVVAVDGNVSTSVLSDGFWHQVGFICDGNGNVSVAFDGTILNTQFGITLSPVTAPRLWLGRDSAGRYFGGGIDEVELRRDTLAASDVLARYNIDNNKDGMADGWEWKYFGTVSVTGTADADGDGVSNLQEYKNGTSPKDYFNGVAPVIAKVSGDSQNGAPGLFLPQNLTVKVCNANGTPLANAPVTFTVQTGGGSIAVTATATQVTTLSACTGTDGQAMVCYKQGPRFGVENRIQVTAGQSNCTFSETANKTPLVAPWQDADLGSVNWDGSASLASGTFGITASGADIWNTQDACNYVYQPLSGDKTIIARVAAIPNPPNTSVKAGVMIRETLDAGSRNVMILVMGGSGTYLQSRAVPNGSSSGSYGNTQAKAPYWVKLVRSGSRFVSYQSADGVNWTLAGTCTVAMGTSGYIGLAVTSHDAQKVASAVFDSVQITADSDNNGLPDAWEVAYFNQIGLDPNALAPRNDGLTILQAYQQGLNPLDYYNGIAPTVTKVSGDSQHWIPNAILPLPLTIRVTGTDGNPLVNAPVSVLITQGGGLVSMSGGAGNTSLALNTDANGQVSVSYQSGASWGVTSKIQATAGKTAITFTANTLAQVGYWNFNRHTGNTTPDYSGMGNTGNLIGGVTWGGGFDRATAPDGTGSMILDGSTGYMEVPSSPAFALGSDPISITAWVCTSPTLSLSDANVIYPIVTLGDGNTDGLSLCFRGGGHGLEAALNTASGIVQIKASLDPAVLSDGYWHQVALVCDGNGGVSVGFDGKLLTSGSGIQILPMNSARLRVGRNGVNNYFIGSIDEIEIRKDVLSASGFASKYIVDANPSNGLPDYWEHKYFGYGIVDPSADFDGDGISTLQEYQNGTNPTDYYNGLMPLISKVSGDGQNGAANCFLAQNLVVLVSDTNGTPLVNAPVTFAVTSGSGHVAAVSSTATNLTTVTVRTGSNGQASGCYIENSEFGMDAQIQATAGTNECVFTATDSPLVAQWNFEDGSGNTAIDTSKTGNSCTLIGGVTWGTGYDGKGALSLDGSSAYLSTAPSPTLETSGSTAFSAALWIHLPQDLALDDEAKTYPILTLGDATLDNFSLVVRGGGHGIEAVLTTGSASRTVISAAVDPSTLCDGNWHHIYFAYDGSGNATLNFDGGPWAEQGGVQMPPVKSPRVWLGRDAAGNYFKGSIDNVEIRRDSLAQADFYSALFSSFQSISGSAFVASSGQWNIQHGAVIDVDRRGSVDYSFTVPTDGIWGFRLVAQAAGNTDGLPIDIPLDVIVDDEFLGRYTLHSNDGATGTITGLTQNLRAGAHIIRIVNWNASGRHNLQINSITILKPEVTHQENGGTTDWVLQKLQQANTVVTPPCVSYTSPVCLEGTARFVDQVQITSNGLTYAAQSGINGQWYSDVPLNSDGTATTISPSFEKGLVSGTTTITWSPLNLAEHDNTTLVIRKGDSLRLTAFSGDGQPAGMVNITVNSGTNTVDVGSTTADVPLVYKFEQSGTYTVQALWSGTSTATLTLHVKEASFGDAIVAYVNNSRDWQIPGIQADFPVEWDNNLSVTENPPPTTGGRDFTILPLASGTQYAVARLNAAGPILARGEVQAEVAYDAKETGDTGVVAHYPDGDRLISSTIVVDALPPGGYAEVRIVVAGVTFTDGTTVKRLYATDFDAHGMATLEFNFPKGTRTSVCHSYFLFDAQGNQVGAKP